jgi:hypothetical protein
MGAFPGHHKVPGPDLWRFYGFAAERVIEAEHQTEHAAFDPVTHPGIKVLKGQFIDIEVHILVLHPQFMKPIQPEGEISVNARRPGAREWKVIALQGPNHDILTSLVKPPQVVMFELGYAAHPPFIFGENHGKAGFLSVRCMNIDSENIGELTFLKQARRHGARDLPIGSFSDAILRDFGARRCPVL